MREGHREQSESYQTLATQEMAKESMEPGIQRLLDSFKEWEAAFQGNGLNGFAREKAASINARKQQILETYRKSCEGKAENAKDAPVAKYDEISNSFKVSGKETLTMGELLTDGEWGVEYRLDKSVPKADSERYYAENAKRELRKLLDELITATELGRLHPSDPKRKAYLARELEPDEIHAGLIAEKMVRNLLKKLAIDNELDFTIEEANIYQDVEQKVDFVIHRQTHRRGVNVEASNTAPDIAVQFTTNDSLKNQEHKKEQIKRVKQKFEGRLTDVVLISLPLADVQKIFHQWKSQKKPGGPDKLWSSGVKEKVVRNLLSGIIDAGKIEEIVEKVR